MVEVQRRQRSERKTRSQARSRAREHRRLGRPDRHSGLEGEVRVSGVADAVYMKSPVWAQQAMVAAWGWWWYRRRFGARFQRLETEYRDRDAWTSGQFQAYQEDRVRTLVTAAWRSPYYRQLFAQVGITPDTPAAEALTHVPCLSKDTLRTRAKDLLTESTLPKGTVVFKSSGTTGTPTEIYSTPEFHAHQTAVRAARNQRWAGVHPTARRVMFGVRKVCRFDQTRPPFWRYSPAEDMAYASVYHLSARFLPAYLQFMREFRPAIIMGYPSALNALAQYALEHQDFPAPAQAIFTTSETVRDDVRSALERVWGCRVFDHYGAVEACVFASQCAEGRYHLSPEIGRVEILDDLGRPCAPGVMGEVVCTGLQNTLQPLIRYRIGDVGRWAADQACPCGRQMPILESVEGRFEDLCYTPDGRQLLRFDTAFKGVDHIREAQVVQERVDEFVVKVVPAAGFSDAAAQTIVGNMRRHVGDCRVRVMRVTEIPRTASGKFRAVVCQLSPEEKRALKAGGALAAVGAQAEAGWEVGR